MSLHLTFTRYAIVQVWSWPRSLSGKGTSTKEAGSLKLVREKEGNRDSPGRIVDQED